MRRIIGLIGTLMLLAPSVLEAQSCRFTSTLTGGNLYVVFRGNDTVQFSQHTTHAAAMISAANAAADTSNALRTAKVVPPRGLYLVTATCTAPNPIPPAPAPPPPPPPPVDTVVTPPPPVDTTTAVGFRFVTDRQLANWQALKAANDPLYRLAVSNCALTGTSGERYADTGLWCSWLAVVNNDATAAAKAIKKLRGINPAANANNRREYFTEHVLQRDLLGRWLTSADFAVIDSVLALWSKDAARELASDSDAITGIGGGAILWELAGGNPAPAQIRPALANYMRLAKGGAWIESEHYNLGTLMLLSMLNRAHLAATGNEVAPGASAVLYDAGKVLALGVMPGTSAVLQWGDEEKPRALELYKRTTLLHAMDHPWAVATLDSLYAKHGRAGYGSAEPWARALLFADPSRVGQTIPADASHLASGMGQLFYRVGQTFAWAMAAPRTGVHHTNTMPPFDVQVYHGGEWVLTHPLGYSLGLVDLMTNTPLYAGLAQFARAGMTWADSGQGWRALAGATSGAHYIVSYPAPPAFLTAGHRVVVLTQVGRHAVVVVRDSVDMIDPRTLANYTSYRDAGTYLHRTRIVEYDGAPWSRWHAPVQPVDSAGALWWQTPNGQVARVAYFADGPTQTTTVDESTYLVGTMQPSEKKWQARIKNPGVLYQVFTAGPGTPPAVSRVGDRVTVGSRSFTVNTSSVVAQ